MIDYINCNILIKSGDVSTFLKLLHRSVWNATIIGNNIVKIDVNLSELRKDFVGQS